MYNYNEDICCCIISEHVQEIQSTTKACIFQAYGNKVVVIPENKSHIRTFQVAHSLNIAICLNCIYTKQRSQLKNIIISVSLHGDIGIAKTPYYLVDKITIR